MIEGEVAFIESLPALLDIIEQSIKHNLNGLLLNNNTSNNNHTQRSPILKDLDFLLKSFKSTTQTSTSVIDAHLAQLESFASQRFQRMTYTEAVKTLRAAPSKIRKKWSFPVEWGLSLQTEHERFLADQVIKGPVFVTDYPAKIKPFYMRQNGDADGDVERETVACCDLVSELKIQSEGFFNPPPPPVPFSLFRVLESLSVGAYERSV